MQWFSNRYVQLTLLTILVAALIYFILWIILALVGIKTFPAFLQLMLALLGAGLFVYKFFASRLF